MACGKHFKPANYDPGAKFCCKACWYEWHQGDRHGQFDQIELTCEWCGDVFYRNPFEVAKSEHHYCGQSCAAKAHSLKLRGMTGGEPQQASYYALSAWRSARMKALERDQFRCIKCGMDEDEHRVRYRTGLHVDHIVPRRYGGGDDLSNLQSLCCICHNKKTSSGV